MKLINAGLYLKSILSAMKCMKENKTNFSMPWNMNHLYFQFHYFRGSWIRIIEVIISHWRNYFVLGFHHFWFIGFSAFPVFNYVLILECKSPKPVHDFEILWIKRPFKGFYFVACYHVFIRNSVKDILRLFETLKCSKRFSFCCYQQKYIKK